LRIFLVLANMQSHHVPVQPQHGHAAFLRSTLARMDEMGHRPDLATFNALLAVFPEKNTCDPPPPALWLTFISALITFASALATATHCVQRPCRPVPKCTLFCCIPPHT